MHNIIFFDIDGTLLHYDGIKREIPSTVTKEMDRLKEAGYGLFVASGRPYTFISETITNYPFDGYILCNGAHVECQGEILHHQPMDIVEVKKLLHKLRELGCEYILETKRESYLHPEYKVLHDFYMGCDINASLLVQEFDENSVVGETLKIEVSVKEEKRQEIEDYIKDKFNYDCHGTENAFEIYALAVTKAVGVKMVVEKYRIDCKNSYAFGDGLNDMEMLQEVGNGIAMGNAVSALKAIAKEVCGDVAEDGLAEALQKLK